MRALEAKALEYRASGGTLLGRSLLTAAAEEFLHWYELERGSGNPARVLPPLFSLFTVALRRGDLDAARRWAGAAEPFLDAPATSPDEAVRIRLGLVQLYLRLGQLDSALAQAQRAADSAGREQGQVAPQITLDLAEVHVRRQEWVLARRTVREAAHGFAASGDQLGAARALTLLGAAHLELGARLLARRDLERALTIYTHLGRPVLAAGARTELGRLCYLEADLPAALAHGQAALTALMESVDTLDKAEVARVSELFGHIFAASGQRNLALKYLNRAAAYYSQLGSLGDWTRATGTVGTVLAQERTGSGSQVSHQARELDFLTAVLDMTDEIESVDPYLRGHSERVAGNAQILAEAAGCSPEQIRVLKYAARLHDVGLVAVDAEILAKPGALTAAERQRVHVHPLVGEEMLRPYGLAEEGLRVIRNHHECWDGSGYPDALAGEQIPLLARIVCIVDIYDALTSGRSFRGAWTHAQALAILRRLAGEQLDPHLVDLFIELHRI